MRCLSCNKILSDLEATRKYASTGEFMDLCNRCFHSGVSDQVDVIENSPEDDPPDDWEFDDDLDDFDEDEWSYDD